MDRMQVLRYVVVAFNSVTYRQALTHICGTRDIFFYFPGS